MEKVEQSKGRACLDDLLRSGIKSPVKKLDVGRNSARAVAVLDGHFMNPICVYDEEGGVTGDGIFRPRDLRETSINCEPVHF